MLAAEQGLDVKILAGTTVAAPGFHIAALVVRPALDIKTAKDVEGHSVGVAGINNFLHHPCCGQMARRQRRRSRQGAFHRSRRAFLQMADLLRSGQIDAATPVEPGDDAPPRQRRRGKLVAYYTDGLPAGTSAYVLMIGGTYAATHPAIVAGRSRRDR